MLACRRDAGNGYCCPKLKDGGGVLHTPVVDDAAHFAWHVMVVMLGMVSVQMYGTGVLVMGL
jgi:hypothetical protein